MQAAENGFSGGVPGVGLDPDSMRTQIWGPGAPAGRAGIPGNGPVLGRIDQYELLSRLGAGAFGVVYLARDTASGVLVAVKTLHPRFKENAEELERVRENFALVQRLQHPAIAAARALYRVSRVEFSDETARRELSLAPGDAVMLLSYAPGRPLGEWRRAVYASDGGRMPLADALGVLRPVASALDYAHGEKIVHRDVKPSNVMVETLGGASSRPAHGQNVETSLRVRILDFGLAAEIRSSMVRMSRDTGATSGTRPYMAPEQWLGRAQDGRADQYALAVMLYEMLSGEPPFASVFSTNDTLVEMEAVRTQTPDPVPGVSRAVNAALMRALEKRPEARYPDCESFLAAVSDAAERGDTVGDEADAGAPLSGSDLHLLRTLVSEFGGARRAPRLAGAVAALSSVRWEKPAVHALRDLTLALLDEYLEFNASSAALRPLPSLVSGRGLRLLSGLRGVPERRRTPVEAELVRFHSAVDRFSR